MVEKRLTNWAKRLERLLAFALVVALVYAGWLIVKPHVEQMLTTTTTTNVGTRTGNGGTTTSTGDALPYSFAGLNAALEREGYKPIQLPANYNSFDVASRFVILLNLVRTDMGLAPLHRNTSLDAIARSGAAALADPNGPGEQDGVWAGASTATGALYAFLFADGYGQGNIDCTAPTSSGCWAHRRALLANYGSDGQIGAAFAWVSGRPSLAASLASDQYFMEVTQGNASSSAP